MIIITIYNRFNIEETWILFNPHAEEFNCYPYTP